MLSIFVVLFTYKLFNNLLQSVQEQQRQLELLYWDSAIDMDDSNMSDLKSDGEQGENLDHNNLIVNYLPVTTSEVDLLNMFQGFGEIESCRLIRHKTHGHSLGYGFVKFKRHDDAQAAIDRLNGLMMQNKKLKVSFARPASDPIKTANLYICGLKNTITEAELIGIFSPYGKVLTVKVMHNDNDPNKTMAIGFVRFEQLANAQAAVDELNGSKPSINPGPIHVSFAKQTKETPTIPAPLANSAYNQTPFNPAFPGSRFGNLGKTPSMLGGKNLRFDPLSRRPISRCVGDGIYPYPDGLGAEPNVPGHVLFVFNLSPEVEEVHLWRLFGPYGAITSVKIIMDKATNRSKGFAFVTMTNYGEAENAIVHLHQTMLEGKVIQVSFKKPKF